MSLDRFASPLDLIAIVYFFLAIGIYRLIATIPSLERRSLVGAVQTQRVRWMLNMAGRDARMLDAILLGSLGQGNAFFASTAAIAVGGLTATLGSGAERLQHLLDVLPYTTLTTPNVWAMKQLLIMSIFIYAFFKFAWAFRLSHYASIMIGATPERGTADPEARHRRSGTLCRSRQAHGALDRHRRRARQQRHSLILPCHCCYLLVLSSSAVHRRDHVGDLDPGTARLLLALAAPHRGTRQGLARARTAQNDGYGRSLARLADESVI
jgi:uncharacterized membrane protein